MYCPYRIGGLNHDTDWITTGTYHYTVGIQSCRDWVRFPDCITTCNRVYFNKQVEWTVSGTPHIVLQIRFACYHYQAHWCDRITSAMWSATWSRTADVRVYPDGSGLTWTLSPTVRSRRLWSWYSDSQHCDERLARNLSEELLVSLQKGPLETPTDGGTGCWLRGWRLSYPEFVPTDSWYGGHGVEIPETHSSLRHDDLRPLLWGYVDWDFYLLSPLRSPRRYPDDASYSIFTGFQIPTQLKIISREEFSHVHNQTRQIGNK